MNDLIQPLVWKVRSIRADEESSRDPQGKGRIFFTEMLILTKPLNAHLMNNVEE